MGYELKHIIAICLIVKLVAFSTEFSIKPQTERLNQGSDTVESPQLTSLAGVKEPWATQMDGKSQDMHFNLGPAGKTSNDRKFNKKYDTKSEQVRINSAFDTCKHMVELLETSKWKDIQKTLHWLSRALASSSNNLRSCRRKSEKTKPKFGVINKKLRFYSPKINLKSKSYFQVKKFSDTLIMNCRQNLINNLTPHSGSEQSEKLKNECEQKYKLGKNKLKHLYEKKSRRKTKSRKHSRKKIFKKHGNYFTERPAKPNNTTTESKSGFSNSEKLYFTEKENEMENFSGEKVHNRKFGFENEGKIYNNLEEKIKHLEQVENQGLTSKGKIFSKKWPVSLELRKSEGKNYKKQNPWPNFVYHRVSSDLFHLGSTTSNHKQSAYIAISVNNSGVPETVRSKNKIFGL